MIARGNAQASRKGPAEYFTGTVEAAVMSETAVRA